MRIQEYTENILKNPSNLQTYTITQNLGNGWRMRTTTPAIDTRPIFLARSSVRPSVSFVIASALTNGVQQLIHSALTIENRWSYVEVTLKTKLKSTILREFPGYWWLF